LPPGFEGDENEEDIWIILRRTLYGTPPKNDIQTPISRALRRTFWGPLGTLRKRRLLRIEKVSS